MAIHWFTDEDREEMARAREDMAFFYELVEKYTVYREASREPLTEGRLRILNGEVRIDPSRRLEAREEDER
jgi:hypothetical protein